MAGLGDRDLPQRRVAGRSCRRGRALGAMSGRTAIGVDVGGTKIATALVDLETGAILQREIEPTPLVAGRAGVMAVISAAAKRMLEQKAGTPIGIGIGLPELVDNAGKVASTWNLDW